MKLNTVVNGNLQMSAIYISLGSTMFLSKKSMFKDGSFLPILSQSGTMLHFLGYFLSSRGTLENLFVRFERTYVGVVFYIKISAGNHYVFAEGHLKNSKNSTFLETPSEKHGLKDWFRVTEFPAMPIKDTIK